MRTQFQLSYPEQESAWRLANYTGKDCPDRTRSGSKTADYPQQSAAICQRPGYSAHANRVVPRHHRAVPAFAGSRNGKIQPGRKFHFPHQHTRAALAGRTHQVPEIAGRISKNGGGLALGIRRILNFVYATRCVLCETLVFFVVKKFNHNGHEGFTKDTMHSITDLLFAFVLLVSQKSVQL